MARIVLDADYEIDFDGERCYTLIRKSIITGEGRGSHLVKKENIGKVRESDCGYFGNITQVLGAYVNLVPAKATDIAGVIAAIKSAEVAISKIKV